MHCIMALFHSHGTIYSYNLSLKVGFLFQSFLVITVWCHSRLYIISDVICLIYPCLGDDIFRTLKRIERKQPYYTTLVQLVIGNKMMENKFIHRNCCIRNCNFVKSLNSKTVYNLLQNLIQSYVIYQPESRFVLVLKLVYVSSRRCFESKWD